MEDHLIRYLHESVKALRVNPQEIPLDHPANEKFGDFSSSVALKLAKQIKKPPMEIAETLKNNFPKNDLVERIDIIKPGFLNFWISRAKQTDTVSRFSRNEFAFPDFHMGPQKKVMVEYAHPNTLKLFHIGHLRNISTGESVVRILEAVGNTAIRVNYQGDVGLHIAKCLYMVKRNKAHIRKLKTIQDRTEFIGKMYSAGTRAYEDDEEAKREIIEINRQIYEKDPAIMSLWKETRAWSLEYFNGVYKRVDTFFRRFFFESELPERGKEIVMKALHDGILEKSKGAIVFNGSKYGLDTRVFVNSLGFPTYEGKELALAEKEMSEFGNLDKCIHVVTPEQKSFFKVTFKVEEIINPDKFKDKQHHLVYEWVKLKHGKMSSRQGNIIEANWLLDETKKKIKDKYENTSEIPEALAVAAVKYAFLKNSTQNQIAFDIEESISIEGNSGPYLLYTFVRTRSILHKSGKSVLDSLPKQMSPEEIALLRLLPRFESVVHEAAVSFSPNLIANFLYDVAQKYNLFYQKCPILKSEQHVKNFRLVLTRAAGNVLQKGLYLLGIKTVETM